MDYRRNIQDSIEYKELIGYINKQILDNNYNVSKLKKECWELWRRFNFNDDEYDLLDKRLTKLKELLDSNLRERQRQDNLLNNRISLIVAITCAILVRMIGEEEYGGPYAYNLYGTILPLIIATIGTVGLTKQYINKNPKVDMVVKESAMKDEENKRIAKEIEDIEREKKINREECKSNIQKYESRRCELYNKEKEKEEVINKKKTIVSMAATYDSINDYERMFISSLNNNRQMEKKAAKILQRGK